MTGTAPPPLAPVSPAVAVKAALRHSVAATGVVVPAAGVVDGPDRLKVDRSSRRRHTSVEQGQICVK